MAPNLSTKSNKIPNKTKLEKNIKKQIKNFKKYIEKNCRNVGKNFSQEARRIHYDNKNSKGHSSPEYKKTQSVAMKAAWAKRKEKNK
jgi:hypothetical protein